MPRKLLCATFIAACCLVPAARSQAQQYVVNTPTGPKVVHTRVAPVIVHRVLPPFRNIHVHRRAMR